MSGNAAGAIRGRARGLVLLVLLWGATPLLSAPSRDRKEPPAREDRKKQPKEPRDRKEKAPADKEKRKHRGEEPAPEDPPPDGTAPEEPSAPGEEPAPGAEPDPGVEGPPGIEAPSEGTPPEGSETPDAPAEEAPPGAGGEPPAGEEPAADETLEPEGVVERALPQGEAPAPILHLPASSGDLVLTIDMKDAASHDREAVGIPQTVRWSPNGRWIAVGGHYKVVRIFEAATGKWVDSRPKPHIPIYWHLAVAWSPDSRLLAAAGGDHVVWVWDSTKGFNCDRGCRPVEIWTEDAVFSPDGRWLANAGKDGRLNIWDMRASTGPGAYGRVGDRTCSPPDRCVQEPKGKDNHSVSMHSVAWSPDGRFLATGSPWGLKIWDATRGEGSGGKRPRIGAKGWESVKGIPAVKHIQDIQLAYDLDFTRDNKYLVAGEGPAQGKNPKGGSWRVRVYRSGSWEPVRSWAAHSGRVHALECSPDAKYVVTGGNREACIWEVETGKNVKTFTGFGDEVSGVTWSPDGQYIAVVAGGEKIDKREGGPDTLVRVFRTGLGAMGRAPVSVAAANPPPGEFDYDKPFQPTPETGEPAPEPDEKPAPSPAPGEPVERPISPEVPIEPAPPAEAPKPPPEPRPSTAGALLAEAEALEKQSRWVEARDAYDQVAHAFPGTPEADKANAAVGRLWAEHGADLLKGMMK